MRQLAFSVVPVSQAAIRVELPAIHDLHGHMDRFIVNLELCEIEQQQLDIVMSRQGRQFLGPTAAGWGAAACTK